MAEIWGAAIIAGGALLGGAISASGAKSAASTQANAANNAAQVSQNEFNTITGQEQPFMNAGYGAISGLDQGLGIGSDNPGTGIGYGSLTQPFTAQNFHDLSPAYQFQQQQGQQGVLNQDASGQGALSGSTLKDLIGYNQGLANTSFNNAFNQYQTQQGNIYSRLSGLATLGQNAASNTGAQGTALAGQTAQSVTNAGTATAAGTIGASNAAAGAVGNLSALPYLLNNQQSPGSASNSWSSGNPFVGSTGQLNYDPGPALTQ